MCHSGCSYINSITEANWPVVVISFWGLCHQICLPSFSHSLSSSWSSFLFVLFDPLGFVLRRGEEENKPTISLFSETLLLHWTLKWVTFQAICFDIPAVCVYECLQTQYCFIIDFFSLPLLKLKFLCVNHIYFNILSLTLIASVCPTFFICLSKWQYSHLPMMITFTITIFRDWMALLCLDVILQFWGLGYRSFILFSLILLIENNHFCYEAYRFLMTCYRFVFVNLGFI